MQCRWQLIIALTTVVLLWAIHRCNSPSAASGFSSLTRASLVSSFHLTMETTCCVACRTSLKTSSAPHFRRFKIANGVLSLHLLSKYLAVSIAVDTPWASIVEQKNKLELISVTSYAGHDINLLSPKCTLAVPCTLSCTAVPLSSSTLTATTLSISVIHRVTYDMSWRFTIVQNICCPVRAIRYVTLYWWSRTTLSLYMIRKQDVYLITSLFLRSYGAFITLLPVRNHFYTL